MQAGKKSIAEGIIYSAPSRSRRNQQGSAGSVHDRGEQRQADGGSQKPPCRWREYQVRWKSPIRRTALAMRWLRDAARSRGEKSMGARLAGELAEAAKAAAAR